MAAKAVAASRILVTAVEPRVMADANQGGARLTFGKLQFKPFDVDAFDYFVIRPAAGISLAVQTEGSVSSAEVQRLVIQNAGTSGGKVSQYTISFTSLDGRAATTGFIATRPSCTA